MLLIHFTGGPDIVLGGHSNRRAADAQVTLTEPVVSVHVVYVLYSHSTIMWRITEYANSDGSVHCFPLSYACLTNTTYIASS